MTSGGNMIAVPTVVLEPTDGPKESDEFVMERIPRRIIQTDKSRDLPLLARVAAMSLRLLNLDFAYLSFDDAQVEEFIDNGNCSTRLKDGMAA